MEISKYIQAPDGVTIHYKGPDTVHAHNPSVLLIHGLASNLTRWSEYIEHTSLHSDYNVYRMDLRGHQGSVSYGRIDRSRWLQDIVQFMQYEAISQITIIGHSLGAQVAQDFACIHSDKTSGIILIDPVFPDNLHGTLNTVKRWHWLGPILLYPLLFLSWLGLHRRHYPHRDLHQLDVQTRTTLDENPNIKIADLYMSPLADLEFIPLTTYLQDLLSVVSPLCDPGRVKCPVRILLSSGASVSDYAENMRIIRHYQDHQIREIQADHWLLTEQPVAAREALDTFVKEIDRH
ncbi:MAG: alpha/beta hydrolase [Gammaproteobacteria bacterium]|nr:alpha/beta hydrolase [Gammaproteobacteria bacterium]